jgi:hypothetical protein
MLKIVEERISDAPIKTHRRRVPLGVDPQTHEPIDGDSDNEIGGRGGTTPSQRRKNKQVKNMSRKHKKKREMKEQKKNWSEITMRKDKQRSPILAPSSHGKG